MRILKIITLFEDYELVRKCELGYSRTNPNQTEAVEDMEFQGIEERACGYSRGQLK